MKDFILLTICVIIGTVFYELVRLKSCIASVIPSIEFFAIPPTPENYFNT